MTWGWCLDWIRRWRVSDWVCTHSITARIRLAIRCRRFYRFLYRLLQTEQFGGCSFLFAPYRVANNDAAALLSTFIDN